MIDFSVASFDLGGYEAPPDGISFRVRNRKATHVRPTYGVCKVNHFINPMFSHCSQLVIAPCLILLIEWLACIVLIVDGGLLPSSLFMYIGGYIDHVFLLLTSLLCQGFHL